MYLSTEAGNEEELQMNQSFYRLEGREGRQLDGFHQVVFVFDIFLLLLGKFEYSTLPVRLREKHFS